MDVPEIPDFKLKKRDKKRREKVLAPLTPLGAPKAGASIALASMGGKIAIVALMGSLGVGAYTAGKYILPEAKPSVAVRRPRPVAKAQAEKPKPPERVVIHTPSAHPAEQSGLAMVAVGGLTASEREARAKEEARARAEAADKALSEAQFSKQAAPAANPAAASALAAGQNKEKKAFEKKLGDLRKDFGSLANGGGLAGGVGRGFDTPAFERPANKLIAMGSQPQGHGVSHGSRAVGVGGKHSTLARTQLDKSSKESRQTKIGGPNETSESLAAAAFGEKMGHGDIIGGSGMRLGAERTGAGEKFTPNPLGPGSMGGAASADNGPDDCKALFPDGTYINSSAGGCVKMPGSSVDPTDKYFRMLKVLSYIALALSVALFLASHNRPLTLILAKVLIGVGVIMTFLGLMVVGMGRTVEGAIFTLMGALTTYTGYKALVAPEETQKDQATTTKAGQDMGSQDAAKAGPNLPKGQAPASEAPPAAPASQPAQATQGAAASQPQVAGESIKPPVFDNPMPQAQLPTRPPLQPMDLPTSVPTGTSPADIAAAKAVPTPLPGYNYTSPQLAEMKHASGVLQAAGGEELDPLVVQVPRYTPNLTAVHWFEGFSIAGNLSDIFYSNNVGERKYNDGRWD